MDSLIIHRCLMRCMILLLCFFYSLNSFAQHPPSSRVLVVYDPNSPDSADVANHYVTSRAIPAANLCSISPPRTATTLSWPVFVSTTKSAIQNCINVARPDQILYLVLAYIRPFAVTAQNGKLYALDQYLADIWDQNDASDPFPYPDQNHAYFAAALPQGNYYRAFISLSNY